MSDTFGVNKRYILFLTDDKPYEEVGIETMHIKEAYTLFAFIAKQVQLFISEKVRMIIVVALNGVHEIAFTDV